MIDVFTYFITILCFASFVIILFIVRNYKNKQDEIKSINEQSEYEELNEYYSNNPDAENEEYEGDDIRDIYNKKTPKYKKSGYQTKNYRGTDIEIAGFENPKDLKVLQKDDLNTIDTEDLDKEVAKVEAEEKKKPVEAPKPDPESLKSGIAATKSAMAKVVLEVKENYLSGKSVSALDNFEHGVKHQKDGGKMGR